VVKLLGFSGESKYQVKLSRSEREHLENLISTGTEKARKLTRARILLEADVGWTDEQTASALDVGVSTIGRIRLTPKHGSWLNMAEIELNVVGSQCLDRRIAEKETLVTEVAAWERQCNQNACTVNWPFVTDDARIKLRKLYPSFYA